MLISGGSFDYRTKRAHEETGGFESGVFAHGPGAEGVAEQYIDLLRRWARDYRRCNAARIQYFPKESDTPAPFVGLIQKRHGAVEATWR
jgi:protein-L-isoaspartate(D-aspartate) O-methyltransferase